MSGSLYSVGPLVTYNWNPSTQLKNFLIDQAGVQAATGSGATIALLGDSTTDGFGTAASNYIATTSLAAQLTAALTADGVVANQADFMGQGNELAINTDARVSFFGGANWTFPLGAGGEVVGMSQVGAGVTFAPGSVAAFRSVTLYYFSAGDAQLTVSVDGQNVGTVSAGSTGLLGSTTLALPAAEIVTSVAITDANGASAYLEGVTLASATPSIQVVDAGVGGAASSAVGAGQPETNPYNATIINAEAAQGPTVAFVDFGINDVLQGNLTAAQTTANLQLIVQELQAAGTEPVIVIPNPITAAGWATEIPTLRADVYALAKQLNVGVIDLSATSGDNATTLVAQGFLNSDGTHPTAAYDAQVATQYASLLTASAAPPTTTPVAASTPVAAPKPVTAPTPVTALAVGTRTVLTASAFLNMNGVDTHIPYTDGGYANISKVLTDLQYLGITNVRDGLSNGGGGGAPLTSFQTLAQAGIKFTSIINGSSNAWTPQTLQSSLSLIQQLQQAVPGSVTAVEGVNEINNQPITWTPAGGATESGLKAAIDLQGALYSAVHSNSALTGVAVDYFTGYSAGSVGAGPNPYTTAGLADYDNQHAYPGGTGPESYVAPSVALGNEHGYLGPAVYTETGYSTNAASQTAQAKGDLDILLDDAHNGVSHTYLYQLLDAYQPGSPQDDGGFGLFGSDGAAKTAAVAIHNLSTILADAGTPLANPVAAGFTVSGLPADGSTLDIEKSDGTHDFIVWNETSNSQSVTVDLGAAYKNISVFDPVAGAAAIATYANVSKVTLGLNGSPMIVQVGPQLAPAPAVDNINVTAPAPVVTLGSGPDTLALRISQDYWQGAAQFTIAVNGVQVGGTQTVNSSVLHSAGADQTFDVLGNFTGANTVSVSFVNDAYNGTPSTDRNLYLDSATINGTTVSNATYAILGDWTEAFAVSDPAPAPVASPAPSNVAIASGPTTPAVSGPAPLVTLGSGPDTLALQISQDYWQGDAQFIVAVNGAQVGGTQTVNSAVLHSAGADQTFDVLGNFTGANTVSVSFVNDAYNGTPSTDRNLYLDSATINGTTVSNATYAILGDWTEAFAVSDPAPAPVASPAPSNVAIASGPTTPAVSGPAPLVTLGSGPDTLALQISQDYWQGDAQFIVAVNGAQVGGTQTVNSAVLHSAGADQTFDVLGNFAGANTVALTFVNDAYAGTPTTDRNLYLDGATINGTTVNNSTYAILGDWTRTFAVSDPIPASAVSGLF